MKNVLGAVLLLLTMTILLGGCASSESSGTQSSLPGSSVPGEKRDATDVTPGMGPGGASANVHF